MAPRRAQHTLRGNKHSTSEIMLLPTKVSVLEPHPNPKPQTLNPSLFGGWKPFFRARAFVGGRNPLVGGRVSGGLSLGAGFFLGRERFCFGPEFVFLSGVVFGPEASFFLRGRPGGLGSSELSLSCLPCVVLFRREAPCAVTCLNRPMFLVPARSSVLLLFSCCVLSSLAAVRPVVLVRPTPG